MIAVPAIDLRDGACVQLVGGSYAEERVRLNDPKAVARRWRDAGFRMLHVVDLDAATETGCNDATVTSILNDATTEVQVGGGVRSDARIESLLRAGAARVVVGTRALEDDAWLAQQAARWPQRIIVAADVREDRLLVHGWTRESTRPLADVLRRLDALPLAGVLVTAVHVEGLMRGPDLALIEDVVSCLSLPLFASGGIASMDDLRALAERGVHAAIIGMALYTNALDPRRIAQEFA